MNGGDFNTDLGLQTIPTHRQRGNHATVLTLPSTDPPSVSLSLDHHPSMSVCLSVCLFHMTKSIFTHAKECIMMVETLSFCFIIVKGKRVEVMIQ